MARKRIPKRIDDTVMFESDRTCCICQSEPEPGQLHHINGDHSNNEFDNLAFLCLKHHAEASSRSSIAKSLSSGVVKKYRDDWYKIVRAKRESRLPHAESKNRDFSSDEFHEALLDAIAYQELRKLSIEIQRTEWDDLPEKLGLLYTYTFFSYGYRVRGQILELLDYLASKTRMGMPVIVAEIIANLIRSALPIVTLVAQIKKKHTKQETDLLDYAVLVAYAMLWDGQRYLKNIQVVGAAMEVIWTVLRYAHLNKLSGVKKHAIQMIDLVIEQAEKDKFADAILWMKFRKVDALTPTGDPLSEFPLKEADRIMEIFDKI